MKKYFKKIKIGLTALGIACAIGGIYNIYQAKKANEAGEEKEQKKYVKRTLYDLAESRICYGLFLFSDSKRNKLEKKVK